MSSFGLITVFSVSVYGHLLELIYPANPASGARSWSWQPFSGRPSTPST